MARGLRRRKLRSAGVPVALAAMLLLGSVARADAPGPKERAASCRAVAASVCELHARLGRGINLGNALEAPVEGAYGITLRKELAQTVKDAGFEHVRLPVRWSNHASPDAKATLDPVFLRRVDEVVGWLLDAGLKVVLDMHHYRQLDGDPVEPREQAVDEQVVDERAVAIWRQLGEHFQGAPQGLIFELYNEPHGRLTPARWNALYPRMLKAVRATHPERAVIVGPTEWNAVRALDNFEPPADRHSFVTVHTYEPHPFTHQGAWASGHAPGSRSCCTPADEAKIREGLEKARAWSLRHGRPVYVGEFGVHVSADAASRRHYLGYTRQVIESLGMPWAVFGLGSDFGIQDDANGQWRPGLLEALLR